MTLPRGLVLISERQILRRHKLLPRHEIEHFIFGAF
jgi:hypothetical protein